MPHCANYTEIERLRLPVIGKFGHVNPADYDPAIEWAHLAILLYQAVEAKWVFLRVRDNTLASFMTGLREVIELWLRTFSGIKYQDQYRHQQGSQLDQVRMATAAGNLAPNLLPICIMSTLLLRSPGEIRDEEDQFETPMDAGDRVHNWFLLFFLAFRYNLLFVYKDLLESWDRGNVEENPPVPLFAGLTIWATSGLHNELATTTDLTMDKPEVAMKPFTNAGMGGVRANYFPDLDMDERSDRVHGQLVGVDGATNAAWDRALSW
ncbi:hypothetical protein BGX38DRAFT_1161604 [Terfezia claveryi]|nr:hypothetical protein BGX38DRAFT_1161604 [Terfezia claveryi]